MINHSCYRKLFIGFVTSLILSLLQFNILIAQSRTTNYFVDTGKGNDSNNVPKVTLKSASRLVYPGASVPAISNRNRYCAYFKNI
jgi:hypothetical protein